MEVTGIYCAYCPYIARPETLGPALIAVRASDLDGSWSGWGDLNSRPLDPQSSALTKLRHSPSSRLYPREDLSGSPSQELLRSPAARHSAARREDLSGSPSRELSRLPAGVMSAPQARWR